MWEKLCQILDIITSVGERIKRIFITSTIFAPIAAFFYLALAQINFLLGLLDTLHSALVTASSKIVPFVVDGYFAKINTVVPAAEVLAMIGFLLALKAVCALIRIIKSVIPTIA